MFAAERLRIALTGGIASGKTRVSDRLAELGAAVIDTDVVAREVVAPGSPGLAEIRDAFGDDVLLEDGSLDRARMRDIVFGDPEKRTRLEAITHPRIRAACVERAVSAAGTYLVFVVPLLVGSEFVNMVDRVLVVDCPRELQFERLMARDGITAADAGARIRTQMPIEEKRRRATIVNDSDLESLARKADALHAFYVALERQAQFARDRA